MVKIVICTANTRKESPLKKVKEIANEKNYKLWDTIEQKKNEEYEKYSKDEKEKQYIVRAQSIINYINSRLNINL